MVSYQSSALNSSISTIVRRGKRLINFNIESGKRVTNYYKHKKKWIPHIHLNLDVRILNFHDYIFLYNNDVI